MTEMGVDEAECDVVVVGYGPVGETLAILLSQHGWRVVVAERWPAPYLLPRAVHFDHEVGRILQSCGIGPGLTAISVPGDVYEWRNGAGVTLLRFGRVGSGLSGWPESSMFNQPALEGLLDQSARALPTLSVRRGVEVTSLEQSVDGVIVRGRRAGRQPVEIRARYAVGCDGANSTVRGLTGTAVVDLGFFYDWLILDVVLHDERVFDPLNLQICDPRRPTTVVSGGPGRRRWEFMRLPDESLDELNDESRAWELLADWDVTPGNATLERHAVYTFNARYAEAWRDGRVLLAGDAAHQMPPFAGQGMCAGIRDAANLAWKLDLVLADRAGAGLLDTYATERMPDARGAIDFSMELGKVICVPDPAAAAARDEAMSAAVGAEPTEAPEPPPIRDGVAHPTSPLAGHLFPQGVVGTGDRRAPFDDVFGAGWRLVTTDRRPLDLDPGLCDWFGSIGGRLVRIGEAEDLADGVDAAEAVDADGTYARWFDDNDTTWALQRPDFHLYGTATGPAAAHDLLRHLHDQLAARQPIRVERG